MCLMRKGDINVTTFGLMLDRIVVNVFEYCIEYNLEDKKTGYSVFEWPDDRAFIGHWKDVHKHGKGILIDSLGTEIEGEWDEGERIF